MAGNSRLQARGAHDGRFGLVSAVRANQNVLERSCLRMAGLLSHAIHEI
jgi:hypothetical protein